MAEPPAKRKCEPKARTKFQEGWKKGRVWLEYDEVAMSMSCSWCNTFFTQKVLSAGHRRDAWIVGCKRLKIEVVREDECSKGHREASEAHRTAQSVQREGGFFARQMQRRDDAAVLAMQAMFWLIKENIGLEKWNSLKGRCPFAREVEGYSECSFQYSN